MQHVLAQYNISQIEQGIVNPLPNIRIEEMGPSNVIVHGDAGPGQVIAYRTMEECIERARMTGFAVAAARNSNHLGAVVFYANMAVAHDLIGFATTTGNIMLPPPETTIPVVGNNPLAWAFPAGQEPPLCLDIATGITAGSKIYLAADEGDQISFGVDVTGAFTTDLGAALSSNLMLPLGAPIVSHKGFGLALVLEVLAGVLAGAKFGRQATFPTERNDLLRDDGRAIAFKL